jgi:hypothetical protein
VVAIDAGVGLAKATMQRRLVTVRLFYDHLVDDPRFSGRGRPSFLAKTALAELSTRPVHPPRHIMISRNSEADTIPPR